MIHDVKAKFGIFYLGKFLCNLLIKHSYDEEYLNKISGLIFTITTIIQLFIFVKYFLFRKIETMTSMYITSVKMAARNYLTSNLLILMITLVSKGVWTEKCLENLLTSWQFFLPLYLINWKKYFWLTKISHFKPLTNVIWSWNWF